ncbi:MAG: nitroreductase family protein [Firmicutes bacterium]|nr:nitroreductase family protein [Bacillota bacterium]
MDNLANVMLDIIKKRRSVRSYTDKEIDQGIIDSLLQAAMAAPSGNDSRPWDFIIVRDRDLRTRLSKVHPWAAMAASSPVVLVVCGDESSPHWIADTSAATENYILQATAYGLGTVWVGIYPTLRYEDAVRQILGIPDNIRVLCLVPTGWPAEKKEPRTRFEASKVHYDRF